jgi:hypothetical protein
MKRQIHHLMVAGVEEVSNEAVARFVEFGKVLLGRP